MGIFGSILVLVLLIVLSSSKKSVQQKVERTQGNFDEINPAFIDIEEEKEVLDRKFEVENKNIEVKKANQKFTQKQEPENKKQKSFDLRQAVIYSTILDRPYK